MIRIILNADDFGKSPERNRAIADAFDKGLISAAGLIVTGQHLQQAVDLIEERGLWEKVHLHINLSANLLQEKSEDAPLSGAMKEDRFFCTDGKFKPYKGLPQQFSSIVKWRVVYKEMVAQYKKFMEVSRGKGDISHLDFHLWYNLTWPVAVALNLFTWRYRIRSVRYLGQYQRRFVRNRVFRAVSWNPFVKTVPSANIDYFLSKRQFFNRYKLVELYCHPHYKDGVFLDDSPSYLKHERQPLPAQVQMLKAKEDAVIVSWL